MMAEPEACNFIKEKALVQVFFCEFCYTSKNIFFTEHLRTTELRCFIINIKQSLVLASIYLFKVNNGDTRAMCEIYSRLT